MSFVHYHLNIGIDIVYLFFDNPDDSTIPLLSDNPKVKCIRCTKQHWYNIGCDSKSNIEIRQTLNADLALKWSRESNIDWIAHIDVDELIYTDHQNIKGLLSSINENTSYLSIPPLEAIPLHMECNNPYKELSNFKILIKDKQLLCSLPKKDETLYLGEYFRSHLSGKSFTRIRNNIRSLNIHKPSSGNHEKLIEGKSKEAFLLHYDCYNYKNWLMKWSRRYDGTAKFLGRENRNKQFAEFCNAFEAKDDKKLKNLYRKMYLIPPETINLLMEKKAARRIVINPGFFNGQYN
jgi:hypothetical protein